MSSLLFLVPPPLNPKYVLAGWGWERGSHEQPQGLVWGALRPGDSWLGRAGLHTASQAHPGVRLSPRPGGPLPTTLTPRSKSLPRTLPAPAHLLAGELPQQATPA